MKPAAISIILVLTALLPGTSVVGTPRADVPPDTSPPILDAQIRIDVNRSEVNKRGIEVATIAQAVESYYRSKRVFTLEEFGAMVVVPGKQPVLLKDVASLTVQFKAREKNGGDRRPCLGNATGPILVGLETEPIGAR